MNFSSSDEAMNGGTVSMCVENTTSGLSPAAAPAYTLNRSLPLLLSSGCSTGMVSTWNPRPSRISTNSRPTAPSWYVVESISIKRRVSATASSAAIGRAGEAFFMVLSEYRVRMPKPAARCRTPSAMMERTITASAMTSPPQTVRTIDDLGGPAGHLEALLNTGSPQAKYAVLLCHPHPLGGGTMHNKVVYHAMKAFQSRGLPVLRFNFRGTGLSQGLHDHGHGEQDDVRAALDWLDRNLHLPILLAGFSFGAYVGLSAVCSDPRVRGAVALGLPFGAEGRS